MLTDSNKRCSLPLENFADANLFDGNNDTGWLFGSKMLHQSLCCIIFCSLLLLFVGQ